jgi:hypothetical protein
MRLSKLGWIATVCLTLMAGKTVSAHHSFDAEYDSKKTINHYWLRHQVGLGESPCVRVPQHQG